MISSFQLAPRRSGAPLTCELRFKPTFTCFAVFQRETVNNSAVLCMNFDANVTISIEKVLLCVPIADFICYNNFSFLFCCGYGYVCPGTVNRPAFWTRKRGKKKTPALASCDCILLTLGLVIKLGRFYVMPRDVKHQSSSISTRITV